jgi:uncharacterized damage-inducible protein DinB
MLVNLNDLLSALGPLGVASDGEGVAIGVACDVAPEPEHPPTRNTARTTASLRTFAESLGRPYDAAVKGGDGILGEFYRGWDVYQGLLIGAIAPLDQAQLDLAPAPHLWSVRMIACHIVAARAWWFHSWMGEGSSEFGRMTNWDEDEALATRPAAEIVRGLEGSWSVIKSGLGRWSPSDLTKEFVRPVPNEAGERPNRSRQWIVWHLVEHDLHHGGEISFSLGMHGITGIDL